MVTIFPYFLPWSMLSGTDLWKCAQHQLFSSGSVYFPLIHIFLILQLDHAAKSKEEYAEEDLNQSKTTGLSTNISPSLLTW